ncbi:hypothetical protein PR1_17 [Providencia phage vB_PreS_PR1]|uniref:Uncharacterized protein n=1 Tax=Providencia phage vB_PreS_PR1 TaxID=1931407 RepID=A0A1S6KVC5_9CAUD|nr:hypothetical protein FDH30_gp017 [Providencia phage vB_PreS_PR1]AQT25365.1 hypothetical protein PR1_17 [Providencia phage vB_PreS_PR1]
MNFYYLEVMYIGSGKDEDLQWLGRVKERLLVTFGEQEKIIKLESLGN